MLEFRASDGDVDYNQDTLSFSWIIELYQGETVRLKVGNFDGKFDAFSDCNWVFNGKFIRNL